MPQLSQLMEIHNAPHESGVFHVEYSREKSGHYQWQVSALPASLPFCSGFWLAPRPNIVGDAPRLYHYKFIMALLSVEKYTKITPSTTDRVLREVEIPDIPFDTDEWTRRSMTLNGMRMTTEYLASGSMRVLELIESRLEARQFDVVHDVVVYLMNGVLDARTVEVEERLLRAEAVVAFLGLDKLGTDRLFLNPNLDADAVTSAIAAGEAGPIRREVTVAPLVENQYQILAPVVRQRVLREKKLFSLMEVIASRI